MDASTPDFQTNRTHPSIYTKIIFTIMLTYGKLEYYNLWEITSGNRLLSLHATPSHLCNLHCADQF